MTAFENTNFCRIWRAGLRECQLEQIFLSCVCSARLTNSQIKLYLPPPDQWRDRPISSAREVTEREGTSEHGARAVMSKVCEWMCVCVCLPAAG